MLGRTKYIAIYRMHSGGSDQTKNILVYMAALTHQSALQKKEKKDGERSKKITFTTHFSITFHFYFLLRLFISGWLLNKRRLSLSRESVTMQLFLKDNLTISEQRFFLLFLDNESRNITPIYRTWLHSLGTRSVVDLKGILIYRRYIGAGCTRSAVDLLKVFTTSVQWLFEALILDSVNWHIDIMTPSQKAFPAMLF